MTLPEAVEQAIEQVRRDIVARVLVPGGVAKLGIPSTLLSEAVVTEYQSLDALRSEILAYGAARERQGIERAKDELMAMVEEYGAMAEASAFREPSDEYRIKANALGIAYVRLGALPVNGATP